MLRNVEKEKDLVDELIASSIRFKQNRVQDSIQIKKPESAIHDFLLIRNYGNVKLGLAICLYKPNLLTSAVEENMINLTSDIALLGLNDELFGEIQIKVES
ncbi:hypothetical protein JCM19046_2880 [Bacillus sp. JCM 19046]|nr:hypothetical protein JCM19046_2880 [Bacillus sp. JCM 19046]